MSGYCILTWFILTVAVLVHRNIAKPYQTMDREPNFPWIGILKVEMGTIKAVTGIVLIEDGIAIANANEISKLENEIIRKSATVIFFETPKLLCNITSFVLYPEFNKDTLNTLAIINLECDRKKWNPIAWPVFMTNITTKTTYTVGFTDRTRYFDQVIFKMLPVNSTECKEFYTKEEINYQQLWPQFFLCYKTADIKHQCVFDSGMALVVEYENSWILVGLSILGPGCALPSRYIEFAPYIPWIKSYTNKQIYNFRRQGSFSNRTVKAKPIDPNDDIVSDSHFIEDDFYISKLNDSTMVLRPYLAYVREEVYGDCLQNKGVIMYRDAGLIRAIKGRTSIGIYALSLHDLHYSRITCVMVCVKCKKRSITKFWLQKGLNKDDLSDIIKIVPHPKKERSEVPPKIIFLSDYYHQYENFTFANLVFKFEFVYDAEINVDFYGDKIIIEPPRHTTLPTQT